MVPCLEASRVSLVAAEEVEIKTTFSRASLMEDCLGEVSYTNNVVG